MTKLNVLALLGIVAVLGMTGCGKKKERKERRDERGAMMKKDHRGKKHAKKNPTAKREMRREERNMFAK